MIRITGSTVGVVDFGYSVPIVTILFFILLLLLYITVRRLRKLKENESIEEKNIK